MSPRPTCVLCWILVLVTSACGIVGERAPSAPGDLPETGQHTAAGHVLVYLKRSGGVTGLRRCASMDTAGLPEPDARWLRETVGGLDLEALTHVRGDPRLPTLDLTVVRDTQRVRVTLDEVSVPAQLRPLIQQLDQRAKPC